MKIVFYHVPKNGGTAIFEGMRKCKNFRRADPKINHIRIKDKPPNFFTEKPFAVIRHPYDRFVSAFYHMNDISNPDHFYHDAPVSDYRTMRENGIDMNVFKYDPNEFLEALNDTHHNYHYMAKYILNNFDIFKSHFYYLQDLTGTMIYPTLKLLNYDNLNYEFKKFVEYQTGCEMIWPDGKMANKRLSTYTIPLTDESKEIIRNIYSDDFKHFKFIK